MNYIKCALFASVLLIGRAGTGAESGKPSLLFILTDEQRYDTLRVYGNSAIQAPHLDRLAREGVIFRRAYVSQPVCSPARSTILTGLWPHQSGVTANNIPLKKETRTLPELVNDPDYRTAFMGKWHLGDELSAQHGFHEWVAMEDGYTLTGDERSPYHHWLIAHGFEPDTRRNSFSRDFSNGLPIEYSKPEFLREKGIEFLDKHKDGPFILYLSFLQPHTPNFGPLDTLHSPHDVSLAPTINAPLGEDAPLRYRLMSKVRGHRSRQEWRQQIAKYWGLVAQVDRSVGAVLAKLRELGLYENTIVVFTSEHGKQMGEHGLWRKTVMYESSSRVPWIIKAPGVQPRVVDAAVSQIHLVPTLLDLLGKPPVESLPGRSLVPVMRGAARDHGDVFLQWNPPSRFVVPDRVTGFTPKEVKQAVGEHTRVVVTQDGWKLCLSDVDRAQLFNLQQDPYESANLFYTDEYRDNVKSLTEKVWTWQRETADTVSLR